MRLSCENCGSQSPDAEGYDVFWEARDQGFNKFEIFFYRGACRGWVCEKCQSRLTLINLLSASGSDR